MAGGMEMKGLILSFPLLDNGPMDGDVGSTQAVCFFVLFFQFMYVPFFSSSFGSFLFFLVS